MALTSAALVCGLSLASACGDDDGNPTGSAGSAGNGGSAGGGAAITAGAGGAAGSGGSAGSAGTAGAAGAAGAGGAPPVGANGTVTVLNDDQADLNTPTTAAIRGTDLWVVNGQLSGLFGGAAAVPPFNVVSIPLAGGEVGATVIELPGETFFPEGIAAAADGTLYIGSLNLGTIFRVGATATAPDAQAFVADTVSERGVVGLTVDEARDTLWFCDSGPTVPGAALVGVNLDTGVETVRHELPDPEAPGGDADAGTDAGADGDAGAVAGRTSFCNDVFVVPNGNIFITESTGRVFRILNNSVDEDNSATVWLEHPAIGPVTPGGFGANGIDLVDNRLVISNFETGALVSVNPGSNNPAPGAEVISLTEGGAPVTLCGPDGLQSVPGTNDLVVVENCGAGVDRVVRITLDLD